MPVLNLDKGTQLTMPELPEVETVCRGLRPFLEGRKLTRVLKRRPDLRFPIPDDWEEQLTGQTVEAVERKAKYVVMRLTSGISAILHLGMSGRILIHEHNADEPFDKHDHIVFETDQGCQIRFNDPRRFGVADIVSTDGLAESRYFKSQGIEPLGNELSGEFIEKKFLNKKTAIKAAVLDQKFIVGVGNIYACESLFFAGIDPRALAGEIRGARAEALSTSIRVVLEKAIAAGGSSLNDYVQVSGELGYFQNQWAVYGREGQKCRTCDSVIERVVQSNRSTFYCPQCQS
jgi:formamidopyrimidine-DNA glycosylase